MIPLKKQLFQEIRKCEPETVSLDDTSLNNLVFHNPNGLRLSKTGFEIIRKQFTSYNFEIPLTLVAKHYIALSRMEFPYAIRRKKLVLFSEMDASVVKLHGGVQSFLEVYS